MYWLFCRCLSGVSTGFPSQFCLNLGQNCLFVIIIVPFFFCVQDNLLGGQFWAMGRFNLLGGQSNLLGKVGKCPPSSPVICLPTPPPAFGWTKYEEKFGKKEQKNFHLNPK